jgi:hypothetical protein
MIHFVLQRFAIMHIILFITEKDLYVIQDFYMILDMNHSNYVKLVFGYEIAHNNQANNDR